MTRPRAAEVFIRRAHARDAAYIADNLRAADRAELRAAGYRDEHHQRAVERSIEVSVHAWTAEVDGLPGMVFGVRAEGDTLFSQVGIPWALGTDAVARNQRALVVLAPGYIREMLRAFPTLTNFVHAENTQAIRWLKRAGFVIERAAPSTTDATFHRFTMRG